MRLNQDLAALLTKVRYQTEIHEPVLIAREKAVALPSREGSRLALQGC